MTPASRRHRIGGRSSARSRIVEAAVFIGALLGGAAEGAPVGPALDRPALTLRDPSRIVALGAATAGTRLVVVGERGSVLLSDDAGARWRQAAVPVSVTLTAVRFVDARQGFAVGHGGTVLATADGGESWVRRLDGARAAQVALQDARASGNARAVREAERLATDGADKPLLDLQFFDARHGIVVGAYNLAFETVDGGLSWHSLMARIPNPKGLHLYAVRAQGDVLLLAGEQGLALRSDDRGHSFRPLDLPYKGSWFTAELTGRGGRDMLLAGLRGNVWRSADGGVSWARLAVPSPDSITGSALVPTAAGSPSVLLSTQGGQMLRPAGAGAGAGFVAVDGAPLPPLNGLLQMADGGVLALSVDGPLRTPGGSR